MESQQDGDPQPPNTAQAGADVPRLPCLPGASALLSHPRRDLRAPTPNPGSLKAAETLEPGQGIGGREVARRVSAGAGWPGGSARIPQNMNPESQSRTRRA